MNQELRKLKNQLPWTRNSIVGVDEKEKILIAVHVLADMIICLSDQVEDLKRKNKKAVTRK